MTDEKIQSFTHENVNLRSSSNNYLNSNHTDNEVFKDVYLSVREFSGNSIGGQSTRPSNQNVFDIPTYLKNYETLQRKLLEDQDSGKNYIQIVRSNLGQTFQQNFQERLKSKSQKKFIKSAKKSAQPMTNPTLRKKKLGKDIVKRYEREFGKARNLRDCELHKAGIPHRYHDPHPNQSQNKSLPWPRKKSPPKSLPKHSTSKKSIPRIKPGHSNPVGHKVLGSSNSKASLRKKKKTQSPE